MDGSLIYTANMTLAQAEKRVILYALRLYRGNQAMTARVLGITPKTLGAKIKSYGAEAEELLVKPKNENGIPSTSK